MVEPARCETAHSRTRAGRKALGSCTDRAVAPPSPPMRSRVTRDEVVPTRAVAAAAEDMGRSRGAHRTMACAAATAEEAEACRVSREPGRSMPREAVPARVGVDCRPVLASSAQETLAGAEGGAGRREAAEADGCTAV